MSNQVGDFFKFLWPFQNVRTLQTTAKLRENSKSVSTALAAKKALKTLKVYLSTYSLEHTGEQ